MRLALHLGAAASAATVAACGGGDGTIDAPKREREIAADIERRTATKDVTVTCPDHVEEEKGGVFHCDLTATGGLKAKVKVTQMDDDGKIRWEVVP